jgi:hypothetical protein
MSWMCEPVEVPVIEHWARCGSCGWSQFCKDRQHAQAEADAHRALHDEIYERSDGLDLGDYLNNQPRSESTATQAMTQENPETPKSPLRLACPEVWPAATACHAWGAPSSHGCKLDPGHDGICRCLCGRQRPIDTYGERPADLVFSESTASPDGGAA